LYFDGLVDSTYFLLAVQSQVLPSYHHATNVDGCVLMALRNRLSPSSNNSCSLGTNAEVGDEPKSLLTEAEMREHQQESNMVSSYWLYSPQPKQSKSRRSFSDLSAEVVCADAEAARATAAAAQAKADLAKATAKAAQASAADGISSPFKENVATQNFPPNSKFKDTLLSLSKTKISTSTLTKSKQPLKTNEGATSNNLNTDLTPKRVFSPIADEKGDSNTYAVLIALAQNNQGAIYSTSFHTVIQFSFGLGEMYLIFFRLLLCFEIASFAGAVSLPVCRCALGHHDCHASCPLC